MPREDLEQLIDAKMDSALCEYYSVLEKENDCEYSGDISPSNYEQWMDIVKRMADLFESLGILNKI